MKMVVTILTFLAGGTLFGQSQVAERSILAGNEFYKKKEYTRAAAEYGKALQADPSATNAKFNQANALYRQDQQVEAVQLFTVLCREATDKEMKSKAFYNKGVILGQQKNLAESIEAYKNAVRNNPSDQEARENLQKALLELKKKTPPHKEEKKDPPKQEQQQQKQPQPKMSPKEAAQRLKLLQQKEKEVQQRLQKEKSKSGGSQPKDW